MSWWGEDRKMEKRCKSHGILTTKKVINQTLRSLPQKPSDFQLCFPFSEKVTRSNLSFLRIEWHPKKLGESGMGPGNCQRSPEVSQPMEKIHTNSINKQPAAGVAGGSFIPTWRIIPVSKWLVTLIYKP